MVGVPTLRLLARTFTGMALWLVGPPMLARSLGWHGLHRAQHVVERWWARRVVQHLQIELDISGLEYIQPGQTYIIAPLHESFADAPALFHLPLPLRFVARDELFRWRWLGPLLRDTGQIEVSPEQGMRSYRTLLRKAPPVLGRGESLVIFPQGTILGIESDFNVGAFALARALAQPILPIALTGGHRVWEHPYTPRLRYGQRMSLQVLPPVTVGRTDDLDAVRVQVQRQLKTAALDGTMAPPRRFVPQRDGYWDGYTYRIDPDFSELAAHIAQHRAEITPCTGDA
jgi:1-acyl-sn-glycerol-3-phosphate acyltransferase